MMNDKRAVERFEFFIVVEFKPVKDQAEPYLGITRNFSREGFSFESRDFDLESGETLEFIFKQPRSDLMVFVQGEIIWRERSDNLQCLTGVRFKEADDDMIWKIMEIVSAAGIATSEFIHRDDTSEYVTDGNGAGQDVSEEEELPSEEPVHGNGEIVPEEAAHSGPSITDTPPGPADETAEKPERADVREVKTENIPETGPAAVRKKRIPLFIPLTVFAIGMTMFIVVKKYDFKNLTPAFTKPSAPAETVQKPRTDTDDGLRVKTLTEGAGPLLKQTVPEEGSALTEQDKSPDSRMTAAETAAVHVTDEIQHVPVPKDIQDASVSADAGPPGPDSGQEDDRMFPAKESASDVAAVADEEESLPETGEKEPLLLAEELLKEKPLFEKSEQTDLQASVPENDSEPVEEEKTPDTAVLPPEIQEIKEKYENMQVAAVPDPTAPEDHGPVIEKDEKEQPPAVKATREESAPETDRSEFDSSVQQAGAETTAESSKETNTDKEKIFAYTPNTGGEEKAPVILNETVPGEETEDLSSPDAALVQQDDKGSQTAALRETQPIKKEKIDVLEELFDDNDNGWDVFNTYAASAEIRDGAYRIENKRKKGAHFTFSHIDFPHDRDFITEVDIRPEKTMYSHSYGFVLGAQDVYNNYTFRIINNRYYLISRYHKGVLRNLAGGTIEKGVARTDSFNTLKVEKRGSTMRFFVNDHFIDEISGPAFDGSRIGFVIEGQLRISVEKIYSQIISY